MRQYNGIYRSNTVRRHPPQRRFSKRLAAVDDDVANGDGFLPEGAKGLVVVVVSVRYEQAGIVPIILVAAGIADGRHLAGPASVTQLLLQGRQSGVSVVADGREG